MTDWSYYEAARRFQRVLVAAGIDSALKARGVMVSWHSAAPPRLPHPTSPGSRHHPSGGLAPTPSGPPPSVAQLLSIDSLPPQDGDTVVIGELEFDYSSDTSESAMYERWYQERRAAGVVGKGQARWPHVTG